MDTSLQVIDAFIDGERVNTGALKAALADAAGRDYFVDVWLMREAVHHDREPALPAAVVTQATARSQPRRWLVAAAVAAGLVGGYAIGYRTTGLMRPQPSAGTSAVVVSTPAARTDAFPVPAPTRVIQLEFQPATTAGGN